MPFLLDNGCVIITLAKREAYPNLELLIYTVLISAGKLTMQVMP